MVKVRIAKLKSAYNSLVMACRTSFLYRQRDVIASFSFGAN